MTSIIIVLEQLIFIQHLFESLLNVYVVEQPGRLTVKIERWAIVGHTMTNSFLVANLIPVFVACMFVALLPEPDVPV